MGTAHRATCLALLALLAGAAVLATAVPPEDPTPEPRELHLKRTIPQVPLLPAAAFVTAASGVMRCLYEPHKLDRISTVGQSHQSYISSDVGCTLQACASADALAC